MTLADFDSLVPAIPFTRRGFLVGTLATGFTLAAGPVMAQTAIVTDTQGLSAGDISVPTADGAMPAYRAQPAGVAAPPVVLVVHEIFGVHEYIKDVCRRLAKAGYMAIAPELYARYGDASKLKDVQDALALAAKAPDAQVTADLDACVAWAKANGGNLDRLGITGFCRGGRTVWLYAAHQPLLKAGVSWYGAIDGSPTASMPRWPLDVAGELKAPVLGLYGAQDQGIPVSDVEELRTAIARAGGKSEIRVYPDAGHAFHADYRPTYRKEPAEDGWKRMLEWFKRYGV